MNARWNALIDDLFELDKANPWLGQTVDDEGVRTLGDEGVRTLGDFEGHEFHGNQWTSGTGVSISGSDAKALLDKLPPGTVDALKLSEVRVAAPEVTAKAIVDDLTKRYGLPPKIVPTDAIMMVDGSVGKIVATASALPTALGAQAARIADAKVGLTAALLGTAAKTQAEIKMADHWLTKVGRGLVERLNDEMTTPYPKDLAHAVVKLLPGKPEFELGRLLTDSYPSAAVVQHLAEHWQEYAGAAKHVVGLEEHRAASSASLPPVVVMRKDESLVYLDDMRLTTLEFDEALHPRDDHGRFGPGDAAARSEKLKQRQDAYEEFMRRSGWEDDPSSILFHGTASKALESIKKNGLIPQGGKGADAWAIANDPHAPASMYARQPAVFLTQDEEDARDFAHYAVSVNPGSRAVVLQVDVPRDKASSLEKDRYAPRAWRSLDRIPPEWIKGRISSRGELKALTAQDFVTIYAVVVVDSDQEKRLRKLEEIVALGGAGSGNFGHAGRPGEVGGSAETGGPRESMLDKPSEYFKKKFETGRDTKEQFSDGKGHYTPERQALHDEIVAKYMAGAHVEKINGEDVVVKGTGTTAVEHPLALVIGGGMASGKSTMVNSEGLAKANTVNVNVDLIRSELPEIKEMIARGEKMNVSYAHEEASDISGQMMREALASKRNMTLDGTGDTTLEKLGGKVALMRASGHAVEANYVTVPVDEAQRRADHRAETTDRRFVPPAAMREVHAAVSAIFPEAIKQGLFDRARLFDTNVKLGEKPRLVVSSVGRQITIHDSKLWKEFLAKAGTTGERTAK